MSSTSVLPAIRNVARRGVPRPRSRAGLALAVIVTCQLMVVLDATVVNIALPSIQSTLHFTPTGLSWVVNAYLLTFGGLLLLGGRAGDILGRRRVFIAGIALFTVASLFGGLATTSGWLLAARAAQGIGGAIASPTALALIASNFAEGPERTRAFGVYAGVSAGGSSLGLVAGGMLTDWVSWRWVLFINVPIGIALLVAAPLILQESERRPGHFDVTGALTSTAGMAALVYGFIRSATGGWSDPLTLTAFGGAAALLLAFFLVESRASQPIIPLRLFANRNRASAYVARLFLVAGMFGMFFFLTQFLQDVLGFSPLVAGLAFLPMTVALFVAAQVTSRVLPRVGSKPAMVVGAVLTTAGMAWLTQISATSGYATDILGPMVLFGLGVGPLFVPLTLIALAGVAPRDSGAASGLVNVMQQVGGSLGLSVLVTVFGTASRHESRHPIGTTAVLRAHDVMAHGVASAFMVAAICTVCLLLLVIFAITSRRTDPAIA